MRTTTLLVLVLLSGAASGLAQSVGVRRAALARVPLASAVADDPTVLAAVRTKNASGESPEQIRARDEEWSRNAPSTLRKTVMGSPCSQRVRELTKDDPNVVEVIVMDRSGANVCVSRETSDYWQGDEEKFQKTLGGGREVFLSELALDQSTGVYSIQLSVLMSDAGTAIGVITLGLRVKQ